MSFDFNTPISRIGTDSVKYDGARYYFGKTDSDQDLIPMWVADMDFAVPPCVTAALQQRIQHPIYGYTLVAEAAFEALQHWLDSQWHWPVEREWIMLMPGVVPSLHQLILALTQPGDGVIVQPPVYPPFFLSVQQTQRQTILNPLIWHQGRYRIDFEHLRHCARQARILLLCSPHNPVGRVWCPDELEQLMHIADEADLLVVSDEIHADLVYPDFQHHSLGRLSCNAARIITACAPSKTFNIPGMALSALIVPNPQHRQALRQQMDKIHLKANHPLSMVAFTSAYQSGASWLRELSAYLQTNRDIATQFMQQHASSIRVTPAEGTYLLWLDCRDLNMNDAELKLFFAQQARVGLSSGTDFGAAGSGFMRMNIATPRVTLQRALVQIGQALARG